MSDIKITLLPCVCGGKARIEQIGYTIRAYRVECSRAGCWSGPEAQKITKAARAWNGVMRKAKDK